ncbi:hypothetical protein AG1IA_05105 [Rhizoctonia solani AG-1 IA]|uniref:Uncharacterized protein n=1 Tax=Thanatephorus cucumeris (strain AG1-IA) TaxID=983506 RepID=L8WRY3_THACA|nr:hypothetical protein AG1IA_05105 [Rhizoctonia solani AG-1 IA]
MGRCEGGTEMSGGRGRLGPAPGDCIVRVFKLSAMIAVSPRSEAIPTGYMYQRNEYQLIRQIVIAGCFVQGNLEPAIYYEGVGLSDGLDRDGGDLGTELEPGSILKVE